MPSSPDVVLLSDGGPPITLSYADALDLLFKPGWPVVLVGTVLHEVARNSTPTSEKLGRWAQDRRLAVVTTRAFRHHQRNRIAPTPPRRTHLGELAMQEPMNDFALAEPPKTGIFLFEDHTIARARFLLPDNCRKVSTRAFLLFLEQKGWLDSAADIERRAVQAGRAFSRLRFPPG